MQTGKVQKWRWNQSNDKGYKIKYIEQKMMKILSKYEVRNTE